MTMTEERELEPVVPTVQVNSEPLTYHQHSRSSYFKDLLLTDRTAGAADRLQRHAVEMDVISRERAEKAWRSVRDGGFEYRVEANRTDGQGGYFSPPLWMNELFATGRRASRTLASLIPMSFDLPPGVSQINLPILSTGTRTQHVLDNTAIPDQDIVDAAGSSTVVTIAGQADVALQLLEQSPGGAHLDWALLTDLTLDAGRDLEAQLINGHGTSFGELLGVVNVTGINAVAYTSGSPTGSLLYPILGEATAEIGDNRDLPPEAWLMRTARWSWIITQESTAGLPFGLPTPFFIGNDDETPDPIGGLLGWPVFCDDAIPATLGAGANQDVIIALRPSDLVLLESQPHTVVDTQVLSGTLGARIQLHTYVAAITNRYPTGISVISGTGLVIQTSF